MSHGKELPQVVDKTPDEIEQAVQFVKDSDINDSTKKFVISCIRLAVWLPHALLEKKISLFNLRKLIFGRGRSKKRKGKKEGSDKASADVENAPAADTPSKEATADDTPTTATENNAGKKAGHGRLSHEAYPNATEHYLTVDDFNAGDLCPTACGGKLYPYTPNILVRVKGQHWASVHKYYVESLRCTLCGELVKATIPNEVGKEKYDAAFKAILAIQKYYIAIPFYRQAFFQSLLKMPLPTSTQWKLIEEVASPALNVFHALEQYAANGDLVHGDDSHLKIIDVIRDNQMNPTKERTGMFTTAILAKAQGRQIVLFYNGTQHAGENMEQLLAKRDPDKGNIIYMCDALSRNVPATFKTILCNCLSHGYRKFEDLKDFYPTECLYVIERLAKVYEHDDQTKAMGDQARMEYHQAHSQPIMDDIERYINALLDDKKIEPNSALGKVLKYMRRHWHELTQFLRAPGAPLDNNIVERALKIPIRGRRTWLFYKTTYGAMIGGVLTSVIHTCALAGENPVDYLTALQTHKDRVVKEPCHWLPWNYQQQLSSQAIAA